MSSGNKPVELIRTPGKVYKDYLELESGVTAEIITSLEESKGVLSVRVERIVFLESEYTRRAFMLNGYSFKIINNCLEEINKKYFKEL